MTVAVMQISCQGIIMSDNFSMCIVSDFLASCISPEFNVIVLQGLLGDLCHRSLAYNYGLLILFPFAK